MLLGVDFNMWRTFRRASSRECSSPSQLTFVPQMEFAIYYGYNDFTSFELLSCSL